MCAQKLYYVQESHGIVVTDLAFLPDTLKSRNIKGNNETALLSVAVDSRCQVHTVSNRSKSFIVNNLLSSLLVSLLSVSVLGVYIDSCS